MTESTIEPPRRRRLARIDDVASLSGYRPRPSTAC